MRDCGLPPACLIGFEWVSGARCTEYPSALRCRRVNDSADLSNAIGGETALLRVFAHYSFVRRDIDAVDFVVSHEAFDPLDLRSKIAQYTTGLFRNPLQLSRGQGTGSGKLTFNHKFRHGPASNRMGFARTLYIRRARPPEYSAQMDRFPLQAVVFFARVGT
jgi:hypothetical protein